MPIHKADYLEKFEKTLNHAQDEFAILRTGRASAQLLDNVTVEAYGSKMFIHEIASISTPDSQLLVIKPWDKSLLSNIEKAIQLAQLNLNPVIDGEIVRIAVPALTQERRQEMVKILQQKEEEAKIMLRSVRADVRRDIEKQKGEAMISEDDIKIEMAELDEVAKEYITRLEEIAQKKKTELLNI